MKLLHFSDLHLDAQFAWATPAAARTLSSDARILVSSFDFAGTAVFDDTPAQKPAESPQHKLQDRT